MSKRLLLAAAFVAGIITTSSGQCLSQFYDGFESGSFSPTWVPGPGNYTNTVPTGSAPAGSYHLSMQSNASNSFYQGLSTTFTAGQPGYMSWWMRTNTTTAANGYVVIGDANIASDNGVLFCYFNATSGLRFFGSTGFNHPISANTWYFVECRNMNWTARTMDIYVNNVLILTGWPFRSTTATSIDRIHLHSLSVATAEYDDFTIGNPAVTATMSFTSPSCFGGTNGTATVVGGGGTGALTYSWAPTGGTGTTESNLVAGTYSVTVTDAIGCTTVGTVTVTEPTAVTATTMQTNVSCFGGNNGDAMVMPSGGTPGYTYLWSNGATTATASGLTAGPLTCTITDVNGCTTVQSVTITEPSQLMTGATNNGDVCAGDTATLIGTATGGTMNYTYDWMPGNLSGSIVNDIPSGTTTYTLQVTDANGCTSTSTTTVTVNMPPMVSLGPDTTVCGGIVLDAQNSGSTYMWSDNSTQQVLNVTIGGAYWVTVTDANGCSASDSVTVSVTAAPNGGTISCSGGTDVCPGDSISLMSVGDNGNLDWWVWLGAAPFWQQIGSGNPFDPGPPALADTGTYQFMAIASNGVCPADTSNIITVIVHVPPVVMLSDTVACGSSMVLDAGNAGSTYLWSDNSTQQQLAVTASGMYSVVVTDQYGCVGSDTTNVTLNPNPVATGTASSMTPCLDDANVTLSGLPAPGTWSGPGVTGNSFDPSVGTGPQILTYTHTDTNGCSGQYMLTVNVNACVGINENSTFAATVYPNPNNGMFSLALNVAAENLLIEITDLQGRTVYTSALSNVQSGNVIAIDVTGVAAGNYIMRVVADGSVSNREIIITK